jgi:hypothetical protein
MPLINDGPSSGFQTGTRTLVIGGVTFVCEAFNYDDTISKEEDVYGESGAGLGGVVWAGIPKGTATLMLTGSQVVCASGASFSTTDRGSNFTGKVTTVGQPEGSQERKKFTIGWRKIVN